MQYTYVSSTENELCCFWRWYENTLVNGIIIRCDYGYGQDLWAYLLVSYYGNTLVTAIW